MKFTMFLAAFTGLNSVTARPTPIAVATNPKLAPLLPKPAAVLNPAARFRWDPHEPAARKRKWTEGWENMCVKALDEHQCSFAIIHAGQRAEVGPDGVKTGKFYHNVEEEKLHPKHVPKRLLVYSDGTSRLGWWTRDPYLVQDSKKQGRYQAKNGAARNASRKAARQKAKQELLASSKGSSSSKGSAERKAEQQLESSEGPSSSGGSAEPVSEQHVASSNRSNSFGGGAKRKAEQQLGSSSGSSSSDGAAESNVYLQGWQSMLEQAKRQKVGMPPQSPAEQRISPNESTNPRCFHSLRDIEAFLELC